MADFADEDDVLLQAELKRFAAAVPEEELTTCTGRFVRVDFFRTLHKRLSLCIQFPTDYPLKEPLTVELKSPGATALAVALVGKLNTLVDRRLDEHFRQKEEELERLRAEGKDVDGEANPHAVGQLLMITDFARSLVDNNRFLPCYDEVRAVRNMFAPEDIKCNERKGTLKMTMRQGMYFCHVTVTVPEEYPVKGVTIEMTKSNFVAYFASVFLHTAREQVRKCVEPPLGKAMTPADSKPSLKMAVKYLNEECVQRYAEERCADCKERMFPEDPRKQKPSALSAASPDRIIRLYCSHLYHLRCLESYMSRPPFKDGKGCLAPKCGKPVFHEAWKKDAKVAEKRWAMEQARLREIQDVEDEFELEDRFLQRKG